MRKLTPLIFISNDDGYLANGLNQLIEMVRPLGRLVVVAPDSARSGFSMAMTSDRPISLHKENEEDNMTVYRCSGTPVDCVKLAFHVLFQEEMPDLILSGINHGDNASVNVHYSGTMGVVLEGCLKGIPSVGFSSCEISKQANFYNYTSLVRRICSHLLEFGMPKSVCLNVNFPAAETFQGIRVCRQDCGDWKQEWEKCTRKDGSAHYWLSGYYVPEAQHLMDTDYQALKQGYVSITPTTVDLTAYQYMNILKDWLNL